MKRREIARRLGLEPHQLRLLDGTVQPNRITDVLWLCLHASADQMDGLGAMLESMEGEAGEWGGAAVQLAEGTKPFEVALRKLGEQEQPAEFWQEVRKVAKEEGQPLVATLAVQKMAELAADFDGWHRVFHYAKADGLDAVRQAALAKMLELMGKDPTEILVVYGDSLPGSDEEAAAGQAFRELGMPVPILMLLAMVPLHERAADFLLKTAIESATTVMSKLMLAQTVRTATAFEHRDDLDKISQELLDSAWLLALKERWATGGIAVYNAFAPNSAGRQVIFDHYASMQDMPPDAWIEAYHEAKCGTPLHTLALQRALAAADDAVPTAERAET